MVRSLFIFNIQIWFIVILAEVLRTCLLFMSLHRSKLRIQIWCSYVWSASPRQKIREKCNKFMRNLYIS